MKVISGNPGMAPMAMGALVQYHDPKQKGHIPGLLQKVNFIPELLSRERT